MFRRVVLTMVAAAAVFARSQGHAAPQVEHWEAVSRTAAAITGDVTFSPERITFQGGKFLPLAPAGNLPGFEVQRKTVKATLYRVTSPSDPVLLGRNTLCGRPVTYIVVWRHEPFGGDINPRDVLMYGDPTPPTSDRNLCGMFSYEAGRHR